MSLDTSDLERAIALTFAALKNPCVVPKDKEIEISLHSLGTVKALAGVQERFEQAIDGLGDAVGVTSFIEDAHEL